MGIAGRRMPGQRADPTHIAAGFQAFAKGFSAFACLLPGGRGPGMAAPAL